MAAVSTAPSPKPTPKAPAPKVAAKTSPTPAGASKTEQKAPASVTTAATGASTSPAEKQSPAESQSSQSAQSAPATPTPSPTPSEAELLGPLPQHTQEEIAARASATPFGIAEIARDPQLWPKQVVLIVPVRFSVIVKGAIAGNLQMPQGRAVLLKTVNADGTVLLELPEAPGTQTKVKAEATDLFARARMLATARQKTPATQ